MHPDYAPTDKPRQLPVGGVTEVRRSEWEKASRACQEAPPNWPTSRHGCNPSRALT